MDIVILLTVAVCGAAKANIYITLMAAALLPLMSAKQRIRLARTYPDVGSFRVLAGAMLLSLANNTVFTVLSYLLGRAVPLLA